MIYYDIIITFEEEVERIWMRKFSLVTVLFFLVCFLPAFLTTIAATFEILPQEPISLAVGLHFSHNR